MYTKLNGLLEKYDSILLTSPHNMRYFCGFSGGEGAVWISHKNRIIFTDSRYIEQAQLEAVDFEVKETADWISQILEVALNENINTVAFEDKFMPTSVYLDIFNSNGRIKPCPESNEIESLRMIKTDAELKIMQKAENICCLAFEKILNFIKPGISEKALAAELEYYIKQEGGDGLAFDTIAISGARCSLPHGIPTDKLIQKGDFVTMDFGAVLNGYCSDMTRTVVVGKATSKQKEIYAIVKDAQQTALEFIKAEILCKDADNAARSVIEKSGYGNYFRHSLGHSVGMLVHEQPNLSPKSQLSLAENMVVTCEPGIYIPGFGGVRIEDMVCVKQHNVVNFTHSTKDLIEI